VALDDYLAKDCRCLHAKQFSRPASYQLAKQFCHRRRLFEQRAVPDRKVATDHAAIAV
jgi:hypothetical protein